jgi:hypothetical protein
MIATKWIDMIKFGGEAFYFVKRKITNIFTWKSSFSGGNNNAEK